MNRPQTAAVLATFSAAFPSVAISEAMALLWAEECAAVDPEAAQTAMRRIVREDQRFPTIARFLEMVRACTPSEIVRALPEPVTPPEEQLEQLAKVREVLRSTIKTARDL